MKKILYSTLFAIAGFALSAVPASAGCTFGLFPHSCGCCGCGAKFCVRQYNAFSPVCSGTVFCNGCCPFGAGYPGCMPGAGGPCAGGMCPGGGCGVPFSGMMCCPPPGCGSCGGGMCANGGCAPGGCADGSCLGSLPPASAATSPATNPSAGPAPLPGSMPSSPTSQAPSYRGIENASYRPAAAPVTPSAAPVRMQPRMMAAPSYWND